MMPWTPSATPSATLAPAPTMPRGWRLSPKSARRTSSAAERRRAMTPLRLTSYAKDAWTTACGGGSRLCSAVTGEVVAEFGTDAPDFAGMAEHARRIGGQALRRMTFHDRAKLLK